MGQNSACCNPTTQIPEPECISLPKELLTADPISDVPEELVEPTEQVLETVRKGE